MAKTLDEMIALLMWLDHVTDQHRKLLAVARAAWKVSDEVAEFGVIASSEHVEAMDRALMQAFGVTDWQEVRGKIDEAIAVAPAGSIVEPEVHAQAYRRPECSFAYCDSPKTCAAVNACRHALKDGGAS